MNLVIRPVVPHCVCTLRGQPSASPRRGDSHPRSAKYLVTSYLAFLTSLMGNFLTSVVGQEAQNRLAVPPESPAVAGFQGRNDGDPHTPSRLHEPRLVDILVAQSMLVKGCKLPLEVALLILDFAEYWAHSSNELNFSGLGRYKTVRGSTSGENMFLVCTHARFSVYMANTR